MGVARDALAASAGAALVGWPAAAPVGDAVPDVGEPDADDGLAVGDAEGEPEPAEEGLELPSGLEGDEGLEGELGPATVLGAPGVLEVEG